MLLRILLETLRRRKRRVAVAVLAVLIGSALVATLFAVAVDSNDRVARELRAYGANIMVAPQGAGLQVEIGGINYNPINDEALLDEADLPKLKTIFWRNNIIGFAPYLSVPVILGKDREAVVLNGTWFEHEVRLASGTAVVAGSGQQSAATEDVSFQTGVRTIAPWWKVNGAWPVEGDAEGAIVGTALAERLQLRTGDRFATQYRGNDVELVVRGIVTTGGIEDNQVFVNLPAAQRLAGAGSGFSRLLVSALTMPKEKLPADIRNKRPDEMTPKEYEKWYCSPTIDAMVKQIEEVIPGGVAKPVRQFSEQEGAFTTKVQLLLVLITTIAVIASALGVMTTMTTLVLERRPEIGLMKAIGAQASQIALIFLAEAGLVGLVGGLLGYAAGIGLANFVGEQVFGTPLAMGGIVLPVTLLLAVGIAVAGSALPVRQAAQEDPVCLLRGW